MGLSVPATNRDATSPASPDPGARVPALSLTDVTYEVRGHPVLDGVSLQVMPGEIVGVAGVAGGLARHLDIDPEGVEVAVERRGGVLEVSIEDDGRGGADPAGSGLTGLRQRVEALDGTFAVSSPVGGPTVVSVELSCAS